MRVKAGVKEREKGEWKLHHPQCMELQCNTPKLSRDYRYRRACPSREHHHPHFHMPWSLMWGKMDIIL